MGYNFGRSISISKVPDDFNHEHETTFPLVIGRNVQKLGGLNERKAGRSKNRVFVIDGACIPRI